MVNTIMVKFASSFILSLACIALTISCSSKKRDQLDAILESKVLKIGLDVGYQPFEMKSKTGEIIGFDIDLAKSFADSLGVELKIVNIEWDGIIPALLANKFDIVMGGMTINEKRKKRVDFSLPYLEVGQLPLISSRLRNTITQFDDLNRKGIRIASRIGTTGEKAAKKFFPKATYKSYQDRETAAMDVIFGRLDAFIYDSPYIKVFNATRGKNKTFTFEKPFTDEPIGLAIKKGSPKLLKSINNFLRKQKTNNFYQSRVRYWFEGSAWLQKI